MELEPGAISLITSTRAFAICISSQTIRAYSSSDSGSTVGISSLKPAPVAPLRQLTKSFSQFVARRYAEQDKSDIQFRADIAARYGSALTSSSRCSVTSTLNFATPLASALTEPRSFPSL